MLTLEYLKTAQVGDTFSGPSGFRMEEAEIEYEVTSVNETGKQKHVTIKGKLFGVDFIKTDAIIKAGDKLSMHSAIL